MRDYIEDKGYKWEISYEKSMSLAELKELIVAELDAMIQQEKEEEERRNRCSVCEIVGGNAQPPLKVLYEGPLDKCIERVDGDAIVNSNGKILYLRSSRIPGYWFSAAKYFPECL